MFTNDKASQILSIIITTIFSFLINKLDRTPNDTISEV